MAVKINGKVYRNFPEQILANKENIEDIIKDKSKMVNNISLNGSTYAPSDGTVALPGLVTTGTEQTVPAKKNFTNLNVENLEIEKGVSFKNGVSINGKSVCRNLYVHKISWKYMSNTANIFKYCLSTKSTPYSSMLDIFAHLGTTNLTHSEIAEYGDHSVIFKFGDAGEILSAVAIGVVKGSVDTFALMAGGVEFVKDEVMRNWGV